MLILSEKTCSGFDSFEYMFVLTKCCLDAVAQYRAVHVLAVGDLGEGPPFIWVKKKKWLKGKRPAGQVLVLSRSGSATELHMYDKYCFHCMERTMCVIQ